MPIKAPQIHEISPNETRNISVDFQGKLDTGELLSGTPIATESGSSVLTITNEQVNVAELTINGETVAIGEAVQFRVSGTSIAAGTEYTLLVKCGTDDSQTVDVLVTLVGV